ncbi:MAG: hypothetical protein Q4E55_05895 [Bacteroidales bacterium]|nr:hypothetical protein [Bacteroidales bacterium]
MSILSWVAAVGFGVAGLCLPPQGEIDGSVLILIAQLLVMCVTFMGVDSYVNIIRNLRK